MFDGHDPNGPGGGPPPYDPRPGLEDARAASAKAPYVYFDRVGARVANADTVYVGLVAGAILPTPGGVVEGDITVAHLRMNRTAAALLRDVLDQLLGGANLTDVAPSPSPPPTPEAPGGGGLLN